MAKPPFLKIMSDLKSYITAAPDHTITVKVTPKASRNRITIDDTKDCTGDDSSHARVPHIRVYVTTVPENGKANQAVIKFLAKEVGIARSAVTITHGHKNNIKTIRFDL